MLLMSLAGIACYWSPALAAGPTVDMCPAAIAAYAGEQPTVDGKLSEAAWQGAPELGPFVQIAGGPAKGRTVARVLRAGDTLFIGFTCTTPAGAQLHMEHTARDSDVYLDESVEVFIDPGLTCTKYFHFVVNPANVQRDESGDTARTPGYDVAWNGSWRSATSQAQEAWYVEIAIPFATLGLKAGAPAAVGLNVCRNDDTGTAREETCWSPTISGFHQPVRFGLVALPNGPASSALRVSALPATKTGERQFRIENESDKAMTVTAAVAFGHEKSSGGSTLRIDLGPTGATNAKATCELKEPAGSVLAVTCEAADGTSRGKATQRMESPGEYAVALVISDPAGNAVALGKSVVSIPLSLTRKYGHRLQAPEELGLWWAESTYKVHRDKPMPTEASDTVRISLARNEYEAAQIVLCPKQGMNVQLEVTDFRGADDIISAEGFKLFQVVYVPVNIPSDKFGWVDDWPDPLPPIEGAVHCKAGENQPFWLLASVPSDARPGIYRGGVRVSWEGEHGLAGKMTVPVELEVYDFALTPETHTRTAYGVGPNFGFLAVEDPDQQREVYDLYMQSCRDHRIAPYSPMKYYPMNLELHAPMRKVSYGRFALEFEQGQQYPWKLYWDGEQIASQRTSQTHFEKEGVGYKGTGVGWPYLDAIESVTEVSRSENMLVLDVVGLRTGSAPAARSFKLTFRFFIPAGDNWFAMKLMKMESTDPTEVEVREYFNIPRTTFKAEEIANGKDFAAWSAEGLGFGMLCLAGSTGGLSVKLGAQGVTVANPPPSRFKIKQGETHEGWGPLVVYFLTEKTSSEELAARAAQLRERISIEDPTTYVPSQPAELREETRDDYQFTHDFTEFDKGAARYLDDFHFNGFNLRCMPGQIGGHKRFTDEYKRLHKIMYAPVIEHLRKKGWLKKAYSYWFDEPSEQDYPYVIEGMKLLGENCPGLTRLLTEQPEPPLYDVIDLWVPVLSNYRSGTCHDRQDAGDLVWWYVCCGPRAPYPNNFVDHPAINHRIRFWMAEKYGVTGSLYWSTTHYGKTPDGEFRNPWKDGMTYRPSGGYWGNGDGMLLYPACREKSDTPVLKGPVASIRWEMLRDGIEDREYFWTLRQEVNRLKDLKATSNLATRIKIRDALHQADEALASPDRLAESLTSYTKDPQDLLREREGVARAIRACAEIR